ncbi:MAG: sigma-54 interaction domain-containing protein [Oligoflexus sp.]
MAKILVLDYERNLEISLSAISHDQHEFVFASSPYEAIESVKESTYGGLILDCDYSYNRAMETIVRIKEESPKTKILAISSLPTVNDAVLAMKNGASDFLSKPVGVKQLLAFLTTLPSHDSSQDYSESNQSNGLNFREDRTLIGNSDGMQHVFELIRKLSKVDTSVLIRGESGTGKELVAQALHFNSARRDGPFVAVNCGAIPENLIESELFGFEKGTFTGADRKKVGKFQFANKGTIFLDEIGDVSQQMQVKLLRVLQEKKITPVGSNQEVSVDVRIVSATNKPLEKMMRNGEFRADLYYRLNVLPIEIPPLRDRAADIVSLCNFMIAKFNKLHNRTIQDIDSKAVDILSTYNWPGNIRELENVIEHAFIIENSDCIHAEALPQHIIQKIAANISQENSTEAKGPISFESIISDFSDLKYPALKEQFEKEFICRALKTYRGRINQTAEQTQMTKVTLLRKLEKYNINPKEFQH